MARRSPGGTFSGRASSQSSFTSGYDGAGAAGAGPLRKMPPIPCPLNGSSRVPGGQRALEQRLLGSPQPLASSWSSCTNGGAQNHPGTTWNPPPAAPIWASMGLLAAGRQFKLLLAYSCPLID